MVLPMKLLAPIGLSLVLLGTLLITFARPLGAWYEGGTVTMSDLGFVVYGMIAAVAGAVTLTIALITRLWRRRR